MQKQVRCNVKVGNRGCRITEIDFWTSKSGNQYADVVLNGVICIPAFWQDYNGNFRPQMRENPNGQRSSVIREITNNKFGRCDYVLSNAIKAKFDKIS